MDYKKQREEVEKLNKQIKELYKQLGRSSMPPIFKPSEIEKAKDSIVGLKAQLGEVRSELDFISRSFRDAFAELSKRNSELGKTKSALNGISRIAQQLIVESEDLVGLDEKRISALEKKAKVQFQSLQISIDSGRLDKEALAEAQNALEKEKEFLATVKQIRKEKELINKDSGVKLFSGLEGLTNAIPGLKQFTPAFQEASKAAQQQAADNLKQFGSTKGITGEMVKQNKLARSKRAQDLMSLRTGKGLTANKIKELGLEKALTSSKTGQLVTGAAAAKMAKNNNLAKQLTPIKKLTESMKPLKAGLNVLGPMLKKALGPLTFIMEMFILDKQIGDAAKQLNLTYRESMNLRREMTQIANASGNNFVTGKKVFETFVSINKALGTTVTLMDDELLTQFTEMREMAGFTNEELQGIAAITLATGKDMNEVTGEFMAQAKISAMQNGVLVNQKDLAKEIGKISAATTLSLSKNPAALGEAVAVAKSLGMELGKVESIAGNLLDFESSISNELQAELLLNRDLNLEKARQAALNNDLATVAEEIAKQAGSAAEFSEMNAIQQEALAQAVGMSREDLAQTLFLQEQLAGLSSEEAKLAQADFDRRVAEVGLAKAQEELAQKGVAGLREQASAGERFAAVMEKLNEIFVMIVEPLMPLLDLLGTIFGLVGQLMRILKPVFDLVSFLGAGLGDLIGSGIGLITGAGADFSNVNKAGKRFEEGIGVKDGYYSKLSAKGDGGDIMLADGGIVTGPTRAIVGEAGPEAVVPLTGNTEIKTDNSDIVRAINNMSGKLKTVSMFEVQ
mgnify:CR=1 FL=1